MSRYLISCEFSGIVRDAFIARGHDATSCDLLQSERPGPHIQGNVLDYLDRDWDGMIAFPPCTYLCNSGSRWLYEHKGRWEKMEQAVKFFLQLWNAPIPKIAIENPIMHHHARDCINVPRTQILQPWQIGHEESKGICLWLKGFDRIRATSNLLPHSQRTHMVSQRPDRWKDRSRTLQGLADAMAEQWG